MMMMMSQTFREKRLKMDKKSIDLDRYGQIWIEMDRNRQKQIEIDRNRQKWIKIDRNE